MFEVAVENHGSRRVAGVLDKVPFELRSGGAEVWCMDLC
jgi:hypothetical protein